MVYLKKKAGSFIKWTQKKRKRKEEAHTTKNQDKRKSKKLNLLAECGVDCKTKE